MSRMHRERIQKIAPGSADRCTLLADNKDIPDPIGRQQKVYNDCADMIEKAVKTKVREFVI